MKDLKEAAREHIDKINHKPIIDDVIRGFIAGAKFAQRWISVDDELPPCSDEDILIKGIDIEGRKDIPDIGYMHSSSNNIPYKENFISLSAEIIKVTHWRPIKLK